MSVRGGGLENQAQIQSLEEVDARHVEFMQKMLPPPPPDAKGVPIKRIMLFPAMFNPPHRHHLTMLYHAFNAFKDSLSLSCALILPTNDRFVERTFANTPGTLCLTLQERLALLNAPTYTDPYGQEQDTGAGDWYLAVDGLHDTGDRMRAMLRRDPQPNETISFIYLTSSNVLEEMISDMLPNCRDYGLVVWDGFKPMSSHLEGESLVPDALPGYYEWHKVETSSLGGVFGADPGHRILQKTAVLDVTLPLCNANPLLTPYLPLECRQSEAETASSTVSRGRGRGPSPLVWATRQVGKRSEDNPPVFLLPYSSSGEPECKPVNSMQIRKIIRRTRTDELLSKLKGLSLAPRILLECVRRREMEARVDSVVGQQVLL